MKNCILSLILVLIGLGGLYGQSLEWQSHSVIDGLSPAFSTEKAPGQQGEALIIATDERKNLHGYWETAIPVRGGAYYSFSIRKTGTTDIEYTPVVISWRNEDGQTVYRDKEYGERYALETFPSDSRFPWKARPEIPIHQSTMKDGSILLSGVFQAPGNADEARVSLHLRYKVRAQVTWSDFQFKEIPAPERKKIKVASVFTLYSDHEKVKGSDAIKIFEPYFEEAGREGVRLVCLPEWLNNTFSDEEFEEVAEAIPGGSSVQFLEKMAKEHDLFIVAGLAERDADTLFNTAVLVGPDGYIGKYRKTGLTLAEANDYGITPGHEYPVFDTEIGRIGMMICYDLYYPEVARKLSENGAEIIAMPIVGGNPVLAQARAIENQVYLITSTNTTRKNWIKTGIYDFDGDLLDYAEEPGTMAIAEIVISDLPKYWAHLGNLKADLRIQAPVTK